MATSSPSQVKSRQARPTKIKPSQANPNAVPRQKPSQAKPCQAMPCQVKPRQAKPRQDKPSQANPTAMRSQEPCQAKSQARPTQTPSQKPSKGKPSKAKPSQAKPSQAKPKRNIPIPNPISPPPSGKENPVLTKRQCYILPLQRTAQIYQNYKRKRNIIILPCPLPQNSQPEQNYTRFFHTTSTLPFSFLSGTTRVKLAKRNTGQSHVNKQASVIHGQLHYENNKHGRNAHNSALPAHQLPLQQTYKPNTPYSISASATHTAAAVCQNARSFYLVHTYLINTYVRIFFKTIDVSTIL